MNNVAVACDIPFLLKYRSLDNNNYVICHYRSPIAGTPLTMQLIINLRWMVVTHERVLSD